MSSQQPNPRNTPFMLAMPDFLKKAAYIDEFSEKMMAPKKWRPQELDKQS